MNKHKFSFLGLTLIGFFVSLIFFNSFFSDFINLHDGDSYYHLAVARKYSEDGFFNKLSWARFSIMHENFGDKEFLFHVFLIPFVKYFPSIVGAKIALAFLNAAIMAILSFIMMQCVGRWACWVPMWLFFSSAGVATRLTRLRPELLSILLLLFITWAASNRKYAWLLLLSFLYTLSYVAFHVPLALAILWFIFIFLTSKEREWKLIICTGIGLGLGLLCHPGFPSNISIWVAQHIDLLRCKHFLDIGCEFRPLTLKEFLAQNVGWVFGLLILWRLMKGNKSRLSFSHPQNLFFINAIVFAVLTFFMGRFSVYMIVFMTLAVFFQMRSRTLSVGRWVSLPIKRKIFYLIVFIFFCRLSMISFDETRKILNAEGVYAPGYQKNWHNLSQKLPVGAKVVAPWRSTHMYVWAAPHAQYLNVLDPVFMAKFSKELYYLQRDLFNGKNKDALLITKKYLESDYVVFPKDLSKMDLYDRLSNDPRFEIVFEDKDVIFRVK